MIYIRDGIFVYKISENTYKKVALAYPNAIQISKVVYYIIKSLLWSIGICLIPIGLISFYLSLFFEKIDKGCSNFIRLL